MRQGTLRRIITYLMLFGHAVALSLTPVLMGSFQEATNVSLSLLPVTAALLTFVVQFHQENFLGAKSDEKSVTVDAAVLTIGLTTLLLGAIIGLIYLYYLGRITTIEELQRAVSLVDAGIIAYLVVLVRRLFERQSA